MLEISSYCETIPINHKKTTEPLKCNVNTKIENEDDKQYTLEIKKKQCQKEETHPEYACG